MTGRPSDRSAGRKSAFALRAQRVSCPILLWACVVFLCGSDEIRCAVPQAGAGVKGLSPVAAPAPTQTRDGWRNGAGRASWTATLSSCCVPGNPRARSDDAARRARGRISLRVSRRRCRSPCAAELHARGRGAGLCPLAQDGCGCAARLAAGAAGRPEIGGTLPVEGARGHDAGRGAAARIGTRALLVPAARPPRAAAAAWLKHLARDRLAAACDRHAATLGRRFAAISSARHAVPLGLLHAGRAADVFVAARDGAAARCWITSPRMRSRIWRI